MNVKRKQKKPAQMAAVKMASSTAFTTLKSIGIRTSTSISNIFSRVGGQSDRAPRYAKIPLGNLASSYERWRACLGII